MNLLRELLDEFWCWCGINKYQYALLIDPNMIVEPFYYPHFELIREICKKNINSVLDEDDRDNFLTCMALDSEEEVILDYCKTTTSDLFLQLLVQSGYCHLQPEARWQIAELLRCRDVKSRDSYLQKLSKDSNPYVRQRARLSIDYISKTGDCSLN